MTPESSTRQIAQHRGFTLIELLVVIAIVSVLVALLLGRSAGTRSGAADAVQEQSEATGCGCSQLH